MKKFWLILSWLLVCPFTAQAQSVLQAAANALAPGGWTQITTNGTSIIRFGSIDGDMLPFAISGVWDASRSQVYFGGNDHGQSEKRLIYYDDATNNWNLIGTFGSSGGFPIDTHGYDHIAINPYTWEIYLGPYTQGAVPMTITKWTGGPSASLAIWMSHSCGIANVANGTGFWSGPLTGATNGVGAYLYYNMGQPDGALAIINPTNGAVINCLTNFKPAVCQLGCYHAFLEYSTIRNVAIFGGGNDEPNKVFRLNANATITALTDAPSSISLGVQRGLVTEDPATGDFLVLSNGQFWQFNPTGSGTWTQLPTPPSFVHYPTNTMSNIDMFAVPISTYGVIMYVWSTSASTTVTLYKHATVAADTTRPSDVTGLTANPVSSSQINLTWNVATDTGGSGLVGYNVYRCSGSGCNPTVQVSTPGTNSQNDTGLSASTLYRYCVRARDGQGNLSTNCSAIAQATTAALDTTAPSVPTGLTLTVISSSQINLSWTASTDTGGAGLAGYNVERSSVGCASGFAQVYTPTTNSQSDTGLTASTTYCYRVRAYDLATPPNISAYSFTQQATTQTGGGGGGNFAARCNAAGVVRCFGFDTTADLGTVGSAAVGSNFGTFNNGVSNCPTTGANQCATIDTTVKAGGAGSMKFVIPTNSGSSGAGQWFTNFGSNQATLTPQFGSGQTFYIQWRQRFSSCYLFQGSAEPCTGPMRAYQGGGGWKIADISGGDIVGVCQANGQNCTTSCTEIEIVWTTTGARGIPAGYNGCPGTYGGLQGGAFVFEEPFGGSDLKLENAYLISGSPGWCPYSQLVNANNRTNCWSWTANEWLTFKVRVTLGTYQVSGCLGTESWCYPNSTVEFWAGREGQPTTKIHSYTFAANAANGTETLKYGKIWLLPYNTGKSSAEVHPEGYTWYDELIISTQDIADPGVTPAGTVVTITTQGGANFQTNTPAVSLQGTASGPGF